VDEDEDNIRSPDNLDVGDSCRPVPPPLAPCPCVGPAAVSRVNTANGPGSFLYSSKSGCGTRGRAYEFDVPTSDSASTDSMAATAQCVGMESE
jgi:hypothetical protein